MIKRLTPETLRRLVLEEKSKVEKTTHSKENKKAKADLSLEGEEDWPGTKSMQSVSQTPGGKLKTLKMIKEREEVLRDQLRALQERRLALRRQIIRDSR